jgi:hypothetical protein
MKDKLGYNERDRQAVIQNIFGKDGLARATDSVTFGI